MPHWLIATNFQSSEAWASLLLGFGVGILLGVSASTVTILASRRRILEEKLGRYNILRQRREPEYQIVVAAMALAQSNREVTDAVAGQQLLAENLLALSSRHAANLNAEKE